MPHSFHPDMHGTIVITGAAPAPTSTPVVAAPAATPGPPTPVATVTPVPPALTLAVRLSPKNIAPGQRIRLTARTLPMANLLIDTTHPGIHRSALHVQARQDGSYSTTIAIGQRAKPGMLMVRGTAILGGQMAQVVVTATIR